MNNTDAVPAQQSNMGRPIARYEAYEKVTGAARYPSDKPLSNPAYAVMVTSPIAKGRVTRIDQTAARAVPGVLEIFTHENTGAIKGSKFFKEGGTSSTTIVPLSST
jgi:xanthine dehydrogenase YagR molybdenum-binding subunit